MKKGVHPDYRPVVFRDRSGGLLLLTRSTLASGRDGRPVETIEYEGTTYPVIDVDVSSASHPFWTGRARHVDTEGRVEKFQRRYGGRSATPPAGPEEGEQP